MYQIHPHFAEYSEVNFVTEVIKAGVIASKIIISNQCLRLLFMLFNSRDIRL